MNIKFTVILLADKMESSEVQHVAEAMEHQLNENMQVVVITGSDIALNRTDRLQQINSSRCGGTAAALTKTVLENGAVYFFILNNTSDLDKSAFTVIKNAILRSFPDIIYSDGLVAGEQMYKPDFGIDTFRSYDYLTDFFGFSGKLQKEVGLFDGQFAEAAIYDYCLRLIEKAAYVEHISDILYRRETNRIYAEEHISALRQHLKRCSLPVNDIKLIDGTAVKISYAIHGEPLVSVLIPTSDHVDTLKRCIDSILAKTTYRNYEIVLIENNSKAPETFAYYKAIVGDKIRVAVYKGGFNFSKICSFGTQYAKGEYYLFLNNDVEIISADWIQEMLMFAQRNDVGACGAMLYYPNKHIQHAGVIIGIDGVAGHSFFNWAHNARTPMDRMRYAQNLSAVTGACILTHSLTYHSVGGFEEQFPSDFNDTDFCLKLLERDKKIVWTPFAELYHYESLSRGVAIEGSTRFESLMLAGAFFKLKWKAFLQKGDPYYNKNYSLRDVYTVKKAHNEM